MLGKTARVPPSRDHITHNLPPHCR
jgi:hypothetical protein